MTLTLRRLAPLALLSALLVPLPVGAAHAASSGLAYRGMFKTPLLGNTTQVIGTEMFSSPVVGDIDGDGQPDIVAGFSNGHIYAWHQDGTRFLDIATPGGGQVRNAPALVDLNHDGKLDILGSNQSGYVYAFDYQKHLLFNVRVPVHNNQIGVFSSPVASDLDHNGRIEIVATSWDHYVWVWDYATRAVRTGFPVFMQDTIWSSPAIADLNGDGRKDIVFGYDCVGTPGDNCYRDYRQGGGYVTAINDTGHVLPGWPRFIPGQVVWSTPAIGDVNGDGKPDVVVGTGLYWNAPAGDQVNAFDATGHNLPGFPVHTYGRVFGSPAIGDMFGDGRVEVTAMDEHNWVYLWDRTGHLIWRRCGSNDGTCSSQAHGASVMADIMGTGRPQVVAAGQTTLRAWDAGGHLLASIRKDYVFPVVSTPLLTQLGGEATVLLCSNARDAAGNYYGAIERFGTGVRLGPAPWPQFRQNAQGTGHVEDPWPPSAPVVTTSVSGTAVTVTATSSDVGTGVGYFDGYLAVDGGSPMHWWITRTPTSRSGSTATLTTSFNGTVGHSYRISLRARDRAGNWSGWGVATLSL